MHLYHFNPNTYAETYTVMAEDREAAIEAVRAHIRAQAAALNEWDNAPDEWPDATDPRNGQTAAQKRLQWEREHLAQLERFIDPPPPPSWSHRKAARIEVYEAGQVVQGEIC